jgi:hypothetical protein
MTSFFICLEIDRFCCGCTAVGFGLYLAFLMYIDIYDLCVNCVVSRSKV